MTKSVCLIRFLIYKTEIVRVFLSEMFAAAGGQTENKVISVGYVAVPLKRRKNL